ncbi:hypothetical protein LVD17_21285 [Fulvivirga ulvae]|uniref:hypothetical protein n=1 Tax=Fulvivirga ulvae TaxID=2904245 RepID=UPI001F2BCD61|nr:hypothetical protein [Fulvivirga ulvae]UII30830.1 hypothetical protein LVD17_21285 [Fulvivirga ulvae]
MRYIIPILFASGFFFACQPSHEKETSALSFQQKYPKFSDYSLEYKTTTPPDDMQICLFANPLTAKVLIYVRQTDKVYNTPFSPEMFSIIAHEGGRAHATEIIPADSTHPELSYIVPFDVVHDRWFYKKTGLPGDLSLSYSLEIENLDQVLNFEIDKEHYRQYQKNDGLTKLTTLYNTYVDTAAQKSYQLSNGLSGFLHADDTEISSAGINLSLQAYQLSDSLKLSVKIVNHSNYELLIQPDVFILKSGSMLLQPVTSRTGMIQLRKGDRFIQDFIYFPEQEIAQFALLKEGIQVLADVNPTNLLIENLQFRRTESPPQGD